MYVIVVEFELRAGCSERFRARVQQQARDTLASEPGCEVFDVCIDPGNSRRVMLYEVYRDRAAFEAHLETAHYLDFDAAVADWVELKTVNAYARV